MNGWERDILEFRKRNIIKRYINGIKNNNCPICGAKISYFRKIGFLDWRYINECPKCKKNLTVKWSRVLWIIALFFSFLIFVFAVTNNIRYSIFVAYVLGVKWVLEILILLPFLKIVEA